MSNTEIITEALNLPLAERLLIVNTLVESYNSMDSDIETEWIKEVKKRQRQLDNNEVETLSYQDFFGER